LTQGLDGGDPGAATRVIDWTRYVVWWENQETEQTISHYMKGVVERMVEAVSNIMFVGVEMPKACREQGFKKRLTVSYIPYAKMTLVNPRMSKREGE
jgi:hypothetical protein